MTEAGRVPLVSVLMPARNAGPYVAAAVGSILAQTVTDLEVICIDDGSTDDTLAVLRRVADEDARVRVVDQGPRGLVATRNHTVQLARGRFLAINDADDLSTPDRLERQLALLGACPRVGAVGSYMRYLRASGPADLWTTPTEPEEIRERVLERVCVSHGTMLVRREALEAVGGYRAHLAPSEDADLELRLSERCDLANIPLPLYLYRMHGGQASVVKGAVQLRALLFARGCARERRRGRPDPFEALTAPPTREDLLRLGLEPRQLDAEVARRFTDLLRELLHNGLIADAERALGEMVNELEGDSVELHILRTHWLLAQRRYLAAGRELVCAVAKEPATLERLARRAVVRARGLLRRD